MFQIDRQILDWDRIWNDCIQAFPLQHKDRSSHGPFHWKQVGRNASYLAARTPGANKTICRLFSMVHDCQRENEYKDPEHGIRAALFVYERAVVWGLDKSDVMFELLLIACEFHDRGQTHSNPTIGVCWDADRLDLPRVGIYPQTKHMSTMAGRAEVPILTRPKNNRFDSYREEIENQGYRF